MKSPGSGRQSHFGAEASGRLLAARSEVEGDRCFPVAGTSRLSQPHLRPRTLFPGLLLRSGLTGSLANPSLSGAARAEQGKRLKALGDEVEAIEARWLALTDQIEQLEA